LPKSKFEQYKTYFEKSWGFWLFTQPFAESSKLTQQFAKSTNQAQEPEVVRSNPLPAT
jgi:hypothetical protein